MGDKDILCKMGIRIYNRRKSLKLTQEKLAEMIDVSTQMISNLELGKKAIRPENLIKLCAALNISADYILTGKTYDGKIGGIYDKLNDLTPEEFKMISDLVEYMRKRK